MPFGRGFATAACLILIALAALALARRLERERRLLAKLRAKGATDAQHAISPDQLTDEDRDALGALQAAGILRMSGSRCYVEPRGATAYQRKRLKLALSGAAAALLLAVLVAFVILHR